MNGKSFFDFLEKKLRLSELEEKAAEFVKQHLKPEDFEGHLDGQP